MLRMGSFSRLAELGRVERRVLARACIMLPACALALRLRGVERAMRSAKSCPVGKSGILAPERIVYLVDAAANRMPGTAGRCLARSLVLQRLLSAHGYESSLLIGVSVEGRVLEAHAWVELDGVPLNATRERCASYAVFDAPPARVSDFP